MQQPPEHLVTCSAGLVGKTCQAAREHWLMGAHGVACLPWAPRKNVGGSICRLRCPVAPQPVPDLESSGCPVHTVHGSCPWGCDCNRKLFSPSGCRCSLCTRVLSLLRASGPGPGYGRGNQGRSGCEAGACALGLGDTHPFSMWCPQCSQASSFPLLTTHLLLPDISGTCGSH